jgi:xanthine dehydrogenase large subunit
MVAQVLGVPHAVTVDPAHGRRLRRQGDAGQSVRLRRRARGPQVQAAGEDPARPRRRHGHHRKAPRFRRRLRVGFDDDGKIHAVDAVYAARCGFSADLSGPVTDRALFHMPTMPTGTRRCGRVRSRSTPTRCPTRPFAASAARRAWSRPSAGSRRSPTRLGSIRSRCASAISTARDRPGVTPYHQTVEDNIATEVVDELEQSATTRPGAPRSGVQPNQPSAARASR